METHLNRLTLLFPALALALAAAACDSSGFSTTPPGPGPAPQTRVLSLTLDPDTVAVGDTTLISVVIEDSLDTHFRYEWGIREDLIVPVNGRLDGPRIRFVAPRTSDDFGRIVSAASLVYITNGVSGTRGVTYSFDIPILN